MWEDPEVDRKSVSEMSYNHKEPVTPSRSVGWKY